MQYDDQGVLLDQAPYPAVYEYKSQQQFEFDHPERMRAIHQLAREQMLQAKLRMKEMANQNRPHRSYEVGDHVRLKLDHIQLPVWTVSKCKKLRGKYFGSFPVVAVHSPLRISTIPTHTDDVKSHLTMSSIMPGFRGRDNGHKALCPSSATKRPFCRPLPAMSCNMSGAGVPRLICVAFS
jgi:hypothetical protein